MPRFAWLIAAPALLLSACSESVVHFPLDAGGSGGGGASCGSTHLEDDPDNCGACAHSCRGGSCSGGQCQPVAMATGLSAPWAVAIDSSNVYFAESMPHGTVRFCAKAGCDRQMGLLAADEPNPVSLLTTSGLLLWANSGTGPSFTDGAVKRCTPKPTGCDSALTIAPMVRQANGVAIDGAGSLYFTQLLNPGGVSACNLDGCVGAPREVIAGQLYPSALAAEGAEVFVASYGSGGSDGAVVSCSTAGCGAAPRVVAANQTAVTALAVDATTVFWTSQGSAPGFEDGRLLSCPRTGCVGAPVVLASNLRSPAALTLFGTQVFWTNRGTHPALTDGSLMSCPKTGCPVAGPQVLATGELDPHGLAVDSTSIFWGTASQLRRLAR